MTDDKLPVAIWEGVFTLYGVPIRCAVLDNGVRVVNAEDLDAMLLGMKGQPEPLDQEELRRFARWQRGEDA